jgi:glucosamine--fructose-6-phosphate aminotransferase (isomerizing)
MIIEGGYCRDILAQPAALEATLKALDPDALTETATRCRNGDFDRVVLTGMGGSYWALYPLHLALLRQRWNSILLETSELIYELPGLLDARTLLVVCSQSGRSAEIVRLLDVKQPDCFTVAICNTPDSPLADRAGALILTRAGEEFTVSSKTYVTALMALHWTADALLGRSLGQSREDLSFSAPAVARYLAEWRSHVTSMESELAGVRDIFVVGRGGSLAAAGIGGLIIKESTHLHGEGMSAAAFRHGPWEMIYPELFALVFSGSGSTAELAHRLAEDIVREGGRAALAGEDVESGAYRLPRVPASVRPIVEFLPVEMLTLALASIAGREAGKFERATKVTTTE